MEALKVSGINFTIFFYNPNIHPRKEYEIRKNENIRFAQKMNVPFVDADYDTSNWFARVKGMEFEPERGIRCSACFDMYVLNERLCTLMNMILRSLFRPWGYRAGRTWIKLITVE